VNGAHIDVEAVRRAYRAVRDELDLSPSDAAAAVGDWFRLTPGEVLVLLGIRPTPRAADPPRRPIPAVERSAPTVPGRRRLGLAAGERLVRDGAYLASTLPLGLVYLIGSAVGLSLGVGLSVVLVGFVVLAAVGLAWGVCLDVERELARRLLGVRFDDAGGSAVTGWSSSALRARVTLRGVAFLALKFPLGVATTIVLAVATALSLAPFAAAAALLADGGGTSIVTVPLGLFAAAAGVGAVLLLARFVDALARAWGRLAVVLLARPPAVGLS
jgi:hypothetical protein